MPYMPLPASFVLPLAPILLSQSENQLYHKEHPSPEKLSGGSGVTQASDAAGETNMASGSRQ